MARLLVAFLLVVVGTLVAFRTDIFAALLPSAPPGLRIVLNLQVIGLAITSSVQFISYLFPGTPVAAFLEGEKPEQTLLGPASAGSV